MSTCTACGQNLRESARFCTTCGQKVAPSTTEAVTAQADTATLLSTAAAPQPVVVAASEQTASSEQAAASEQTAPPPPVSSALAPVEDHVIDAEVVEDPPEASLHHDVPPAPAAGPGNSVPQNPAYRYPQPGSVPSRQFDAAAMGAAAAQARAHADTAISRIPLPQEQINAALRDGALLAAASLGAAAAVIGLVDVFNEGNSAPMMWARTAIVIVALALRAPLTWEAGADLALFDLGGSFDTAGALTFMPLGLTAILAIATYALARRTGKVSASSTPRTRLTRALITGLAFGLIAAAAALSLRFETENASLGTGAFQVLIGGTIIIAAVTFVGLGAGAPSLARLPRVWADDVRTGADFALFSVAVPTLIALGYLAYALMGVEALTSELFSLGFLEGLAGSVVGMLIILPVIVVTLGGLLLGANVRVDTTGGGFDRGPLSNFSSGQFGILEGIVPGQWLVAAMVVSLLMAIVVGVRATLRSPLGSAMRIWQPAVFAAFAWGVLAWLTSMSAHAQNEVEVSGFLELLMGERGDASVGVTLGLSIIGIALAAACWTVVAVIAGRHVTATLGRSAPGILAHLTRGRADDTWKVAVTDAVLRHGQAPPKHLAATADGLRSGAIAPPATAL